MNTMTLNIDIPSGIAVDANRLKALATKYVQQYVLMLQSVQCNKKDRTTAPFRSMRGVLNSNMSYEEMRKAALTEKYKL